LFIRTDLETRITVPRHDDDDESMKSMFAQSYSLETVTSVLTEDML